MKRLLLATAFILGLGVAISSSAHAGYGDVYVSGYTKSNGTYVAPHYRSRPDGVKWNNKSYRGY